MLKLLQTLHAEMIEYEHKRTIFFEFSGYD
jgi:hypothetical protein